MGHAHKMYLNIFIIILQIKKLAQNNTNNLYKFKRLTKLRTK